MAKFGTKQYYRERVEHNICTFTLLAKGLACIINEEPNISPVHLAKYVSIVNLEGNQIEYNMKQAEEAKDEDEDEE